MIMNYCKTRRRVVNIDKPVVRLLRGLLAPLQKDRLSAYEALRLPIFAKEKSMKIGLIKVNEDDYSSTDE